MRVCQRWCASSSPSSPRSGFKRPLALMKGYLQCLKEWLSSWQLRQSPRFSRRASAQGERRPLQRGGSSVLNEAIMAKLLHNYALLVTSSLMCGQAKGQMNHRWEWQLNDGSIPSATKATGTALGPGRAHDRQAGAPMGRMTALPSEKQGEKKSFTVDGRCLIVRLVTKSPPHSIQRGVWPWARCLRTRVQRRQESRKLVIRRHPTTSNTRSVP